MDTFSDDYFTNPRKRVPLWLFIIELLDLDEEQKCLAWTHEQPYEFKVKNPDELASLWGSLKENPTMTYSKLTRGLRYYYGKNIIEKVPDRPFTYRFAKSKKTEKYLRRFKFADKPSNIPNSENKLDAPQPYSELRTLTPIRRTASSSLSESEFYIDFEVFDDMLSRL